MPRYLVLTLLALCVIGCSDQRRAQTYLQKGQYQKVIAKFKGSPRCSTEVAQASQHVVADLFQTKKFCDVVQQFQGTPFQVQACESLYAMGWYDNLKECCQGTEAFARRLAEEQAQAAQAVADSIAQQRHYEVRRPDLVRQADALSQQIDVWVDRLMVTDVRVMIARSDRWLPVVHDLLSHITRLQQEVESLPPSVRPRESFLDTKAALWNLHEAGDWLQVAVSMLNPAVLGSVANPDPLGSTAYRLSEIAYSLERYKALMAEANQTFLAETAKRNPSPAE